MWSHNFPLKLEKSTRAISVSEECYLGGEMTSSLEEADGWERSTGLGRIATGRVSEVHESQGTFPRTWFRTGGDVCKWVRTTQWSAQLQTSGLALSLVQCKVTPFGASRLSCEQEGRVWLVSSEWRPGMLLHIVQCTRQPSGWERTICPKMPIVPSLNNFGPYSTGIQIWSFLKEVAVGGRKIK